MSVNQMFLHLFLHLWGNVDYFITYMRLVISPSNRQPLASEHRYCHHPSSLSPLRCFGEHGCEDPAYSWKILSRSQRGVWVVEHGWWYAPYNWHEGSFIASYRSLCRPRNIPEYVYKLCYFNVTQIVSDAFGDTTISYLLSTLCLILPFYILICYNLICNIRSIIDYFTWICLNKYPVDIYGNVSMY